jgi:5-aminolevulinate synthase
MNGSIAPIEEIIRIAKKYNALTFVDEVHAVGVYGKKGSGICEILKVSDQIDIIQGSLAKGFGLIGGYITGQSIIIDAIRSCSSGFIFTSTMPIPVTAGCIASVNYLKNNSKERELHWANVAKFLKLFDEYDIPLVSNKSNIMSVPIFGAEKVAEVSKYLLEKYNIYVQHINYPTVKKGEERLRITTNPSHNDEMIERFVKALYETMKFLGAEDWSKKAEVDFCYNGICNQVRVMDSVIC